MRPPACVMSVLALYAMVACAASSETLDAPDDNMSLECQSRFGGQDSKVPEAYALLQMPQSEGSRQMTSASDDGVHAQRREGLALATALQVEKPPFRPHFCHPLSEGVPKLAIWHVYVGIIALFVFIYKALRQPIKIKESNGKKTRLNQ